MLRFLALASLYVHLGSLEATQTVYGAPYMGLRWWSLFAMFGFGLLAWAMRPAAARHSVIVYGLVATYFVLWLLTVLNSRYALFSFYRWAAHAMAVSFGLVFLPAILDAREARRLIWFLIVSTGGILVWSFVDPAALTIYDIDSLFRGVFGNANSLGAMAVLAIVLNAWGLLTSRQPLVRVAHISLVTLGLVLLLRSSSRSAVVALVVALVLLVYLFRATLSRAMVLATLALALSPALLPTLSGQIGEFMVKERPDIASNDRVAVAIGSRIPVWTAHWNGFKEKPILGWGFGLDSDADLSAWKGELTALSLATRDPVNDVLFALESGGLTGLLAYLIILSTTFVAWLPGRVRRSLDRATTVSAATRRVYDCQRLFLVLSVMYIALFEGDSTAFAAGNFAAAMLWVTLGGALWGRSTLTGQAGASEIETMGSAATATIPRPA